MELPENALVLIYAAEFSGRKNQKMLISAMPELPNAVLLLPGRGALLEDCRTLAQQKGRCRPRSLPRIYVQHRAVLPCCRPLRVLQPQRGTSL